MVRYQTHKTVLPVHCKDLLSFGQFMVAHFLTNRGRSLIRDQPAYKLPAELLTCIEILVQDLARTDADDEARNFGVLFFPFCS